ncbi:MAG TPA: excinuclease ABC subunit UvrB [Acidimicrobiales bacterium]|nr:excinuclease ABC subunit UvrB [Acidimicrobiales bacterium]
MTTERAFRVQSPFQPAGDQPQAIAALSQGVLDGLRFQTLEGITGSGKTATIAWMVEQLQRPTLVIEPNKSLAAQLAAELKEMLPDNRVEFFVSYYDYYQPEAYIARTDTYIEKDSSINDEIDRLRHASTSSLLTRRDTVVVASVSCIYGLGSPEEYAKKMASLVAGESYDQRALLRRLVDMHYTRNDMTLLRGTFRVRGDTVELLPSYEQEAIRFSFFGDVLERISVFDPLTGDVRTTLEDVAIYAASHYVAGDETMARAIESIEAELQVRLAEFQAQNKLLEVQRLRARTEHDLEMLAETGTCAGIENYSRHLDGRAPGERPYTLLDYFPEDFLVVVDESHVAVPQLNGQYAGDKSRKDVLVEHGFRLPSALDNRPLRFDEFLGRVPQIVFVSATPGPYEAQVSDAVVEQVIRPTGLVDPPVEIVPTRGQIDDLRARIATSVEEGDRVLVTTLTKKMAEDLTSYLADAGVRVQYLHSDIDTIERIEILRSLRLGEFDVLVGINLLREGLDLPEVGLVAILDADKEGFLRSSSSLIQTIGRAARNARGRAVLYADTITDSMRTALSVTERRRAAQLAYNAANGIDPQSISSAVKDILGRLRGSGQDADRGRGRRGGRARQARPRLGRTEATALHEDAGRLEREMLEAAKDLRFEEAAALRDELHEVIGMLAELTQEGAVSGDRGPVTADR